MKTQEVGAAVCVCVCFADVVLLMGKTAGHLVLNSSKPAVAIEQNTVCEREEEEEEEMNTTSRHDSFFSSVDLEKMLGQKSSSNINFS